MKREKLQNTEGFSLVELLIAIGIFAFVFAANFGLAMDAYRSRANDRIKLEAGLVFKDKINGLYNYKNDNWSEIIRKIDDNSKKLDLVDDKYQINDGKFTQNGVEYEILLEKAARSGANIDPENSGTDPDTVKVSISAAWKDFFGIEQSFTETYFLTNWASTAWREDTNDEFTTPVPTKINSTVANGSVSLTLKPVYSSTDWCTLDKVQTVNLFPNGTGDVFSALGKSTGDQLTYKNFEPTVVAIPTNRPAPSNPIIGTINNAYPDICDDTGVSKAQCEALLKIYDSTAGDSWLNKNKWKSMTENNPCTWYGVTCTGANVTNLNLSSNNLSGSLPREVGALVSLTQLNLSGDNTLTGVLPPEIGNLTALSILNLSRTAPGGGLTGVVPETIGNMTSLQILNLANNSFEGKIPQSIGRLSALTDLYLQNNNLTCHIAPEIANLSNIGGGKLNLSNNHLLNTNISALNTYFVSKSANVGAQGTPILHEDCMQRPDEDEVYLSQYNTTESETNPFGYGITLASEAFPPALSKEVLAGAAWLADKSNALSFDGGDYVEVPASKKWNIHNEDSTISLWVKRNGQQDTGSPTRLIDYSDAGQGWYLGLNASEQVVFSYDGTGNDVVLTSATITDTPNWHHVVVVMDSGTATLFLNGTQAAQDTYDSLINHTDPSKVLRIGKSVGGNGFIGTLDEIKIYSRAVPINELTKSKGYEAHRKEGGLIGYWRLNQAGETQYDLSYQSAHGTKGGSLSPGELDDPLTITNGGNTRYRINDLYIDGDIIYISSTHPVHDIARFDKSTSTFLSDININNDTYQGFDDTASTVTDQSYIYIGQGSYLHKYTKVSTPIHNAVINLSSPYNSGNITDLAIKDGFLFVTGIKQNAQLSIQDVSFTPTPKIVNLLLEAYL